MTTPRNESEKAHVIIEESGSGGVQIGKIDGPVIRRGHDDDDGEEGDEDDLD